MINFMLQAAPTFPRSYIPVYIPAYHAQRAKQKYCTSRHIIVGQKIFTPEISYLGLELQMIIHNTCTQRQQRYTETSFSIVKGNEGFKSQARVIHGGNTFAPCRGKSPLLEAFEHCIEPSTHQNLCSPPADNTFRSDARV